MTDTTTKMPEATLEALRGSIAHWERLARCETAGAIRAEGFDGEYCALCNIFMSLEGIEQDCLHCPVAMKTGRKHCYGSPYYRARSAAYRVIEGDDSYTSEWQRLATAELDFLKSLLPREEA